MNIEEIYAKVEQAMEDGPVINESWRRLTLAAIFVDRFQGWGTLSDALYWSGLSRAGFEESWQKLIVKHTGTKFNEFDELDEAWAEARNLREKRASPLPVSKKSSVALSALMHSLSTGSIQSFRVMVDAFTEIGVGVSALPPLIQALCIHPDRVETVRVLAACEALDRVLNKRRAPELSYDERCFEGPRSTGTIIRSAEILEETGRPANTRSLYARLYDDEDFHIENNTQAIKIHGHYVALYLNSGGVWYYDCRDEETAVLLCANYGWQDGPGFEPDRYSYLSETLANTVRRTNRETVELSHEDRLVRVGAPPMGETVREGNIIVSTERSDRDGGGARVIVSVEMAGHTARIRGGDYFVKEGDGAFFENFEIGGDLVTLLVDPIIIFRGQAATPTEYIDAGEYKTGAGLPNFIGRHDTDEDAEEFSYDMASNGPTNGMYYYRLTEGDLRGYNDGEWSTIDSAPSLDGLPDFTAPYG